MTAPYLALYDMLSKGTRQSVRRRTKRVKLGEGHSARARAGMNNVQQVWSLRWDDMTLENKDLLKDFFDDLGDVDHFRWTPVGGDTELKFVANSFEASANMYDSWDIVVEVEQVYDA